MFVNANRFSILALGVKPFMWNQRKKLVLKIRIVETLKYTKKWLNVIKTFIILQKRILLLKDKMRYENTTF